MPNIVKQLNLYLDKDGSICVGISKSKGLKGSNARFPILLPKVSIVTDLIVSDIHQRFNHAGLYTVHKELRTKFWIPHCFVIVKKSLKKCVHCKSFNSRTLKVNQTPYRTERLQPIEMSYSQIYIDYVHRPLSSKFK